jgi:hypothetical protein
MSPEIIQINWLYVDTVVILLLVIFLLAVKFFKEIFRWRSSFSNVALNNFIFKYPPSNFKNKILIIKNVIFTRNNDLRDKSPEQPIVIIFNINKKHRLMHILTEGLASYGFDVINLFLKSKYKKMDMNDKEFQTESSQIISIVFHFLKEHQIFRNYKYMVINSLRSRVLYNQIILDDNNIGMILVNPLFDSLFQRNFNDIIENNHLKSKLYIIFSKKYNSFLNNRNLIKCLKTNPDYKERKINLLILEKSNYSFKFYETILLSMIIKIIKLYSLNS